jgi:deoxycytidine triphosphate deaminase
MRLSYYELRSLIERGVIDAPFSQLNGASIDVRISDTLLVEAKPDGPGPHLVDVTDKQNLQLPKFQEIKMDAAGYALRPGGCVLVATVERFRLPFDITCELRLKSTIARCFTNHLFASWCDPGWGFEVTGDTRLTMELHNCMQYHYMRLVPNMKIGQMIFERVSPVPRDQSYAVVGQYNGTSDVAVSRGVQ